MAGVEQDAACRLRRAQEHRIAPIRMLDLGHGGAKPRKTKPVFGDLRCKGQRRQVQRAPLRLILQGLRMRALDDSRCPSLRRARHSAHRRAAGNGSESL
jgi:hypothetical protein